MANLLLNNINYVSGRHAGDNNIGKNDYICMSTIKISAYDQ